MEPKKSSALHQPHAMEPKKSSPRGAGAAAAATEPESTLSSLFSPPATGANGKDHELYNILYKGQGGSAQAGMTDGKSQWSPSKSHTSYMKDNKQSLPHDLIDTTCFGSSVHYGGRDYFYSSSTTKQGTESSTGYKADKKDKKDPIADSHGDWWQGSFYY